jgi:hypothetical protein
MVLASSMLESHKIWTKDKQLRAAAREMACSLK